MGSERTVRNLGRVDPAQHAAAAAFSSDAEITTTYSADHRGITASIFHIINSLAVDAIESGRECITDASIENWEPEFDAEAAFA